MKVFVLSSSLLYFLCLVFFTRQLHKFNLPFSLYLGFSFLTQLLFVAGILGKFATRIPIAPLQYCGWVLVATAIFTARGRQDATNGIINDGLWALVILAVAGYAGMKWHVAPRQLRALATNLVCLAPTSYMLVRFTFTDSDPLICWIKQIPCLGYQLSETATAAVGVAKAIFS